MKARIFRPHEDSRRVRSRCAHHGRAIDRLKTSEPPREGIMHMTSRLLFVSGLLACGFLPARLALAAWPSDPLVNVPICTATGAQTTPAIISDGAGGAIVAWADARSGNRDIYVQRISADGVPL